MKRRILFVCTGNTCRSPMAEGVARRVLALGRIRGSESFEIASAGVWASPGAPAATEAVIALRTLDADLSGHESRLLTAKMIEEADAVFGMTEAHVAAILEVAPEARARVHRLNPDADISDPIGMSQARYNDAALEIARWVEFRLRELAAAGGGA